MKNLTHVLFCAALVVPVALSTGCNRRVPHGEQMSPSHPAFIPATKELNVENVIANTEFIEGISLDLESANAARIQKALIELSGDKQLQDASASRRNLPNGSGFSTFLIRIALESKDASIRKRVARFVAAVARAADAKEINSDLRARAFSQLWLMVDAPIQSDPEMREAFSKARHGSLENWWVSSAIYKKLQSSGS